MGHESCFGSMDLALVAKCNGVQVIALVLKWTSPGTRRIYQKTANEFINMCSWATLAFFTLVSRVKQDRFLSTLDCA
jgi:hypothetical protein